MGVINLTLAEKVTLAERYDQNKVTFERVLARDLRAFFSAIGADIFAQFTRSGSLPDFNSYLKELEIILEKNYRRVGGFFSAHLQRLLRETMPKDDKQKEDLEQLKEDRSGIEAILLLLLAGFYKTQAKKQAGFIMNTTKKVVRDAATAATIEGIVSGSTQSMTQEEIARAISKQSIEKNLKRVPMISDEEVGVVANKASQAEAVELKKKITVREAFEVKKTWITRRDNAVRNPHRFAHNQEREILQPYNVGGELLMEPKDPSLGASGWNRYGCRCASIEEV